jgi:RNA polymerase nonessential primary-like sigma factor
MLNTTPQPNQQCRTLLPFKEANVTSSKLLTRDEEAHLCNVVQGKTPGDRDAALTEIYDRNSGLLFSLSMKFNCHAYTFDDAYSDACIGFFRAIELFEPEHGTKLSTYATNWIMQALRRGKRLACRVIPIPEWASEKLRLLNKFVDIEYQSGREVTTAEIAKHLDNSEEQVEFIRALPVHPVSFDTPIGEGSKDFLVDFHAAKENTEKTVTDVIDFKHLAGAILSLLPTDRDRDIIRLRFAEGHSLQEVANLIGISRQRVSQIELKLLFFIRRQLGITDAGRVEPKPSCPEQTAKRNLKVLEMADNGVKTIHIANHFGLSVNTVNCVLKAHGKSRPRTHGRAQLKTHTKGG